jgi:DNA (cytosine-5)-methyltransferase 1
MSWLYSQVLVAEYLGENYSDGEQSVPLSGNSTQLAYLPQDKMTDYSRLSRFGMMFKPLTEQAGEELLMSYRAAFRVKTFLPQEKEPVLTESGQECGKRWQGLLARLDPNLYLWKTVQCSLLEDSEQSFQTFPRWGSMRNGECFQQPMLEQITSENEYGLLQKVPNNLDFFHTPNTTGLDGGSNSRKALKKRMTFPTPTANLGMDGSIGHFDYKSAERKANGEKRPSGAQICSSLKTDINVLPYLVNHRPHPNFCEWLMGWPQAWTDLKPLEMDKYPYVQQPLGTFLKED